jgi:hypothetical protein
MSTGKSDGKPASDGKKAASAGEGKAKPANVATSAEAEASAELEEIDVPKLVPLDSKPGAATPARKPASSPEKSAKPEMLRPAAVKTASAIAALANKPEEDAIPATEKPADAKPLDKKPADGKATAPKPTDQRPAEGKPAKDAKDNGKPAKDNEKVVDKKSVAPAKSADDEASPNTRGSLDAVPDKVDAQARLKDPIAQLKLANMPFGGAVRLVRRMGTLPIAIDLDAIAEQGGSVDDPIRIDLSDTTIRGVLDAIASARGLEVSVQGDVVALGRPKAKAAAMVSAKHDVADLAPNATATIELTDWVRKLVAPKTWKSAGGQGVVQSTAGTLLVDQSPSVQWQVERFLDRLRLARGLSPRGAGHIDRSALTTLRDQAWPRLRKPVTSVFLEKTPLERILRDLEEVGEVKIVVDWRALAAEQIPQSIRGTLSVDRKPLYAALNGALQPLGLIYRIVGPDLFEVTTRTAAANRLEVEFYPAAAILSRGLTPESLAAKIKSDVVAGSQDGPAWGDAPGQGALWFDKSSNCLVVLQSQRVQARLQSYLGKLMAESDGKN